MIVVMKQSYSSGHPSGKTEPAEHLGKRVHLKGRNHPDSLFLTKSEGLRHLCHVAMPLLIEAISVGGIIFKTDCSSSSTAVPNRPDRCSRPARTKCAAVVSASIKTRSTEIVPFGIVPVIARHGVDIPRTSAFTCYAL